VAAEASAARARVLGLALERAQVRQRRWPSQPA